jgi:hypothetical protein
MLKRCLLFTALLLSFITFNMKIQAQMPPLIDRELFFGNPEIAGAQFRPTANTSLLSNPTKTFAMSG